MAAILEFIDSIFDTKDIRLKGGHCEANCAIGKDFLTVYLIETPCKFRNQGEAQRLLLALKEYAQKHGQAFRVWAPITNTMIHICKKLKIKTCGLEEVLEDGKKKRNAGTDTRSAVSSRKLS